jgi:hypothetical protein
MEIHRAREMMPCKLSGTSDLLVEINAFGQSSVLALLNQPDWRRKLQGV